MIILPLDLFSHTLYNLVCLALFRGGQSNETIVALNATDQTPAGSVESGQSLPPLHLSGASPFLGAVAHICYDYGDGLVCCNEELPGKPPCHTTSFRSFAIPPSLGYLPKPSFLTSPPRTLCVRRSRFTLARRVARSEMHAGNFTA